MTTGYSILETMRMKVQVCCLVGDLRLAMWMGCCNITHSLESALTTVAHFITSVGQVLFGGLNMLATISQSR